MSGEEKIKTVCLNIMLLKSECDLEHKDKYIENYSEDNIIIILY